MSFDFLTWWESFSEAPFVLLIVLLLITHFFYHRYFRHTPISVASPSILMALGGFALIMPELHINITFMLITAIELVLLWVYLTIALLYSCAHGNIAFVRPINKLEMGTWIGGTAVTLLVIDQIEPTLYGFILWLGLTSLIFYIVYLYLLIQWVILYRHRRVKIDGRVMLPAIAALSIALLIMEVFGSVVFPWIYQIIICAGAILSVLGVLLIIFNILHTCRGHFFASWPSANCLIYAAFAMLGLAALETHSFSHTVIFIDWCLTMTGFVMIEFLEILRLVIRVSIKGFLKAVGVYHVLQWLRIFSLAMLHGFAMSYYNHHYISSDLLAFIANYAQYVVLVLILFELSLMVIRIAKHGEFR